jgi:uncharacterized protein (TIGR03435 family)
MTRLCRTVSFAIFALFNCRGAYCQSGSGTFQTFTIKANATTNARGPLRVTSNAVEGTNTTFKRLIGFAYGVQETRILGPAWIEEGGYDLTAKADRFVERPELLLMLQRLLQDHFALELHKEKRELPGYWLLVAEGGSHLRPFNEHGSSDASSGRLNFRPGFGAIFSNKDLPEFAERLSRGIGALIVDKTGIQGRYWFQLEWKAEGDTPGRASASLMAALREQLGLTLEPQAIPAEVVVVDNARKP